MNYVKKLRSLLSRREKKIFILILLASIFISFLETFSISLVMLFAVVATNFSKIASNPYYAYAYKLSGCSSPDQFIVVFGFLLIGFYFFRGITITLFTYVQNKFAQGRFKSFAFKFFQNYLNFKYKDFTSKNSSYINKMIFVDSGQLTQIVSAILVICAESLTITFIYFSLLWVNWKMTGVLTFLLGIKILFVVKTFSKKLEKAGKNSNKLNIELYRIFTESFGNFKLIKLLSNERPVLKKFDKASSGLVRANTLNMVLQNTPRLVLETIGFSVLISIIMYVIYMYGDASSVVPVVSMYAFAFYRFLPSINKVLSEYNKIIFCKHALDSVQEYLVYDLEDLGNEKINFQNQIELRNVSFNYDVKSKILNKVSLNIKKGQRTAFVGESGAGKSTIVDIVMGLYKPQDGALFIDGKKLTASNVKSWRNKIGYIPQQIYLFDGTVAQNIVFGREYDEQQVISVLKKANMYNFLLTQDGINTKVGEGGIKLSGGQKQRVAIARALYSNPDILVLDEATSALDNKTESKIMDEIYSLNKDKTLIIVAHRLSTVERCENIYRLEKGGISFVEDLYGSYGNQKMDRSLDTNFTT